MDAEVYVEIMEDYIVPDMRRMYGNNWYLHQDNDPKHQSNLTRSFLAYNNITWVFIKKLFLT